jgi:hypothetical protein
MTHILFRKVIKLNSAIQHCFQNVWESPDLLKILELTPILEKTKKVFLRYVEITASSASIVTNKLTDYIMHMPGVTWSALHYASVHWPTLRILLVHMSHSNKYRIHH